MTLSVDVTYTVRIHDEGPDGLWADVAELPGCFASGDNHEELMESLKESVGLYLSASDSPCVVSELEMGPNQQVEERKLRLVSS
jgi:predicted RNase H-like HicB family nuclease